MPETANEAVPFLAPREVEDKATEVRKRHNLTTVPIDLVLLAQRDGIRVNNARFSDDNIVGMIVKRRDDVSILVNSADPPFRKRFTIAHELGHLYLHLMGDGEYVDQETNLFRQKTGDDRATTPDRRREIQANMFAASLLMPEDEVRRYWQERRSIEGLARVFNVSAEAMGYRLDSLGLD
jgi:Zn-dependent peptidase ImmA (M78 family)